jgi:hypothetical protein
MAHEPTAAEVRADLRLIDEDDAAEILEIAPKTLRNYRMRGIGPRYAIVGRKIQYTPDWLRDWVSAGGTHTFEE